MASSRSYLNFVSEQLSGPDDLSFRAMMGECILYYKGKIVGGIYDDRLLVKSIPAALALIPDAVCEAPYPGAKDLLLVENVDDRMFLAELLDTICGEFPAPKKKK